jgi:hypothetical protein
MKTMKFIASLLLLRLALSQTLPTDPEHLKFLTDAPKGSKITIDKCLDNPPYDATNIRVQPDEIDKGSTLQLAVAGIMSIDTHVKELDIKAFLEKQQIFSQTVDKSADVKKGDKFIWKFSQDVPTDVPSGNWETYIRLMSGDGVELCCIKASWTI